MKSKSSVLVTLAVGLFLLPPLASPAAVAESDSGKSAGPARAEAARERLQSAFAELNLTPEQKEKLTPILRAEMQEMAALRTNQSLSRREKLQRLKAIQDNTVPRVKEILTPEQFAKWQVNRAEARGQLRERARERRS